MRQFAYLLLAFSIYGQALSNELYWLAGDNSIKRASVDGTSHETIVEATGSSAGLSVDDLGGHLYWVSQGGLAGEWTDRVYRANLDGSNVTVVAESMTRQHIQDVEVDARGGFAYYSGRKIWRVNLHDGTVEEFGDVGADEILLDLQNRMIYWADDREISRSPLDEFVPQRIFFPDSWGDIGLGLDAARGKIYWAGARQDLVVGRINLDGTSPEEIVVIDAVFDDFPSTLALDLVRGRVYFANLSGGSIFQASLNGSNLRELSIGETAEHIAFRQKPHAPFRRGDCNGDGSIEGQVGDAVFLLRYNFSDAAAPPCLSACDADGDGEVFGRVTDAIYLLNFNFLGGPLPPEPFQHCGSGNLQDQFLGCEVGIVCF